jgi:hypothetical protein
MSLRERFWLRANKTMGADLLPGVDLGLSLASLLLAFIIDRTGVANTLTSIITIIGAMPLLAAYHVRRHRESFNTQGSGGFLLYLRGLFWFLMAFAVLGGIGYLFARFGGPGS